MIGNDVVDLAHAPAPRDRFVERVLCEEERARFEASGDQHGLLWTLFAAKEAAYKAISRRDGPIVFAHRAFVVAADLASIRFEATVLTLEIDRTAERVHALAYSGNRPTWAVARASGDASEDARRLLRGHLAPQFQCRAEELAIIRDPTPGSWDGFAPPRVSLRGAPVAIDVSLSHDGGFVACAADLALDL
jgi:phosphopantetheinyl transferase (holo-ACP synthase)